MKTSELTGAELDSWVAKAEGYELDAGGYNRTIRENGGAPSEWYPSTDWGQGGQIIERERIMLMPFGDGYYRATIGVVGHPMCGDPIPAYDETYSAMGHTPLIAAMRAFVSSVFGSDVDATA